MPPFVYTLLYGLCLAFYTYDLHRTPDRDPSSSDAQPPDEPRFLRLALVVFLLWWVAFLLPFFAPPTLWMQSPVVPALGFVIMLLGLLIRQTAIRTLDRFFTYQLCLRPDHRLIQEGIYRILRHPSYTGTLLEITGLLLIGRFFPSLLLFGASAFVLFFWRIRREEALLTERFGDEYRAYQARSWRLVPWLF